MDKKCRKCGVPIPGDRFINHRGLIDDDELWVENARNWCIPCQEAFLKEMGDYNDKEWDCIEVQDGKEWERADFRHLVKKHGLSLVSGGSFHFPISGLKYGGRRRKRRSA